MTQEIGPWNDEPDTLDFDHAGLRCAMRRNHAGAWCGYVAVPEGHPLNGKEYDALDVRVHGGLTWSAGNWPVEEAGLWWFGFDCAHLYDFCPKMDSAYRDGVYRDAEYVKNECQQLAEQIAAWQPPRDPEADLREALDALAAAYRTGRSRADLTCRECCPMSDIIKPGFRCWYHQAPDLFRKHGRAV